MRRFDTLLWDLDGTLLDFKQSERYALGVCLAQYGVTMTEEMLARYSAINEGYWKRLELGEITKQELLPGRFRDFFAAENITHIDPVSIQERYQRELGTKTFYIDDSLELLIHLKELGYRQYMVTNGVVITQNIKMKNSGFDRIVDGVFISDELGFEKPRAEFFEKAFERIPDFHRENAILIGDSLTSDMRGANNAGVCACWYNPDGKENDKGVTLDYEIDNLQQLYTILGEEAYGKI
ncbi:MAG: YjjG family noncanonical pyrimidine nucleotidase [Lachnospiraceae bacterium]